MRKTLLNTLALTAALVSTSVWAGDEEYTVMDMESSDAAGMAGTETTTRESGDFASSGGMKNEIVGIKPQVGALATGTSSTDSRIAYGLTADMNLASTLMGGESRWYMGPSTGVIYSNRGAPGSNFFASSDQDVNESPKLLLIPANLKIGYNLTDGVRVSAHGGGNAVYRNQASNLAIGTSGDTKSVDWSFRPNAGLDFEFGLTPNLGLIIRPDVTFNPGNDFYTGTIGLNALIG